MNHRQRSVPPPPAASTEFQEAIASLSSQLETTRGQAAEHEAWNVFCATQLLPNSTPLPKDVPGSIVDAWQSLTQEPVTPGELLPSRSTGQRETAVRNHCIQQSFQKLVETGQAVQSARQNSPESLKILQRESNASVWLQTFYDRLRQVQTYHAQQPIAAGRDESYQREGHPVADGYDLAASIPQWISAVENDMFTTDEVMGKYLDLQSLHKEFVQSFLIEWASDRTMYVEFLEDLSKGGLSTWSEAQKLSKRRKYARWLVDFERYLRSFLEKTVPLINMEDLMKDALVLFQSIWGKTGGWKGWELKSAEAPLAAEQNENTKPSLNMADFESADDLVAKVNPEALKVELSLLGLKSGGTPLQRAERLFLLKEKKLEDLPAKMFQKKRKAEEIGERRVDLARREAVVAALLDRLRPTLEATIRRTERRQTQTLKEREKELEDELKGVKDTTKLTKGDDSDEEDGPIYNPKNVPLDYDGKPIPYWLFKLHGLNHYYPCEICGGESYRGRKAFELHFNDVKHASAMRSLGIPNTKHFHGVTTIEDAQELWKSLQAKLEQERFDTSSQEEYEDSHGNVLSRKKYEDLARQGLL